MSYHLYYHLQQAKELQNSEQLSNFQRPSHHSCPQILRLQCYLLCAPSLVFQFMLHNRARKLQVASTRKWKLAEIRLSARSESKMSTNSQHLQVLGLGRMRRILTAWNTQLAGKGLVITILGEDTGSIWYGMRKKQREMLKPLQLSYMSVFSQCSPQSLAQAEDFGFTSMQVAQKLSIQV